MKEYEISEEIKKKIEEKIKEIYPKQKTLIKIRKQKLKEGITLTLKKIKRKPVVVPFFNICQFLYKVFYTDTGDNKFFNFLYPLLIESKENYPKEIKIKLRLLDPDEYYKLYKLKGKVENNRTLRKWSLLRLKKTKKVNFIKKDMFLYYSDTGLIRNADYILILNQPITENETEELFIKMEIKEVKR